MSTVTVRPTGVSKVTVSPEVTETVIVTIKSVGPQGPAGDAGGATGPAGPQGDQGIQGIQGIQGPIGPQGIQGETGPTGPAGPTGPKGDQGIQGATGATGATGAQGIAGAKGDKGDTGDDGTSILSGLSDPNASIGNDGDQYLNRATGDWFVKNAGTWGASDLEVLITSDIGVSVQAYDATILVDADIGVNVQAYSADLDAVSGTNTGDQEAGDFNHDDLANITGTPAEYNHPTDAQMTVLGNTSGTNSGDEVVATGTELDTGTDDVKYASALAIKNSHNVPSVAPGTSGNVLTSDGTDWTSATPAEGITEGDVISLIIALG